MVLGLILALTTPALAVPCSPPVKDDKKVETGQKTPKLMTPTTGALQTYIAAA